MIPEYGGNVRRSSQAATDALLDENADIEATDPEAGPVGSPAGPTEAPGDPASQPPPPALPPELFVLPFSETLDPGLEPPPPPPPPVRARSGNRRLDIVPPILLAALGLVAAIIAWRVGVAGNIADDANRAGIEATRQRALTTIQDEGSIATSVDAFLQYERDRRRADALAQGGDDVGAQLNRMTAAAFWDDVAARYLDRSGQFQPAQQRAALLAQQEQTTDIQPLAHFEAADAAYVHLDGLILAGIVVALALPFLTLAEIGKGRLRVISVLIGVGIFGGGIVLAATAWI